MIAYRPDIDGLRALAVSLVVLFHGKFGIFTGGFIGVDIFFVISGYLIASIILSEIKTGTFSIAAFYERRIRRILPALVAVITAVMVAGALIFTLPRDFERIGASARAALAFYSNFYFARQTGYFGPASETQPLLHTWSLGVEEQFYIFAPLVMIALINPAGRWKWPIMIGAFGLSLALSVKGVAFTDRGTFYWPHTRAFELLTGVTLAMAPAGIWIGRRFQEMVGAAGLALVLAAAFWFTSETPFPGFAALIPCLGAALVIGAGGQTLVSRALAAGPLVKLGKISYSLYLWHWPVFVFAGELLGQNLHVWQRAGLVILALMLSIMSYLFVEQPFRSNSPPLTRRSIFTAAAVATAVCGLAAQAIVTSRGWPDRLPPEVAAFAKRTPTEADIENLCAKGKFNIGIRVGNCEIGAANAAEATFLLWGDSHARSIATYISDAAAAKGIKGYYVARSGCAPLYGFYDRPGQGRQKCQDTIDRVKKLLASKPSIKQVIVVARWVLYARPPVSDLDARMTAAQVMPEASDDNLIFKNQLQITVKDVTSGGRNVALFGPVPEPSIDLPKAMILAKLKHEAAEFPVNYSSFQKQQRNVLDALAETAKIPNVQLLYPHEIFCNGQTCATSGNDQAFYVDSNHLSPAGVERLSRLVDHAFNFKAASPASLSTDPDNPTAARTGH